MHHLNEPHFIVTSFNANFAKRNDGNPFTKTFVTSPETVRALDLYPATDIIPLSDGIEFKFQPPTADYLMIEMVWVQR